MKLFMIIDNPGINFSIFIDTKTDYIFDVHFKSDINVDL